MLIYDINKMKELLLFYAENPGRPLKVKPADCNWNEIYLLTHLEIIGIYEPAEWYKSGGYFYLLKIGIVFLNILNTMKETNPWQTENLKFYLDKVINENLKFT